MSNNQKNLQNQSGFSLIELIISISIILMMLLGVYNLIIFTIRLNADNQNYVIAMNIANQKMEYIRNLPYNDVGTITGSPAGIITENISEGIFDIHTTVMFYDDPYDGTVASGTDSIFVDYKIATIDVSWTGRFAPKTISVFSKIIPNTEETLSGYGLLKLLIVDSSGAPVSGADIHIENSSPLLNANYSSDSDGILRLPLLPDTEGYEVTVTKPGLSTDKTYDRNLVNPNPTKPHLSVFTGVKTEESFAIDTLGSLIVRTVSNNLPDNYQINTELGSTTDTMVKFDSDVSNNMYLAWQSYTGTSTAINIQKFDSNLNKLFTNNKTISSTNNQLSPDIAVTKTGKSFVVWQDDSSVLKSIAYNNTKIKLASNNTPKNYHHPNIFYQINASSFNPTFSPSFFSTFLNKKNIWINNTKQIAINIKNNIKTQQAHAQVSGSIVQSAISPNVNWNSIMTATLSSTPTVGNMLLAIAVTRNHWINFNTPSNSNGAFTDVVYSEAGGEYLELGMWYKEVEASEPTNTSITASQNIRGGALILMEINKIDLSHVIDVVISNNQTNSDGTIANTGTSAISANSAFAIAAVSFADNNFNTANSSNWSSVSSSNWTHEIWEDWSTGHDGTLAIASMNITSAETQKATLSLSGGGAEERNSCLAIFNLAPVNNATLSSDGNQTANLTIGDTDNYLGGSFIITENSSSRNITAITVEEDGSVDAQNSLDNFRLFYDLDTTAPYDCASESFNILTDSQFGTTSTFNASDGQATLTEPSGIEITTSKTICLYPVVDINTNAQKNETLNLLISNPSSEITVDTGIVIPASPIEITNFTTLLKPAQINQTNSRWRNDDDNEILATWAKNENSAIDIAKNNPIRLRFGIHNSGSIDTTPIQYKIEYGQLMTTCDAITTWNAIPTNNSLHWQIIDSTNLLDNATTSNVVGGITDMNINFIEGYTKDTSNITPAITLASTDFTEIEYSIQATTNATDATYCFRLTNNGSTTNFNYDNYPKANITGDNNIYIIGLDSNCNEDWSIKKVNSDSSDFEQTSPRLALSENFGSATTCIVWEDYRNGQADIYAQSFSATGTKLWASDLQITSSSTNETKPVVAIDSQDNIYISWTNHGSLSQDIYLQKINFNASFLFSNPIKITASSSDEYNIDITTDSHNNLFFTWTDDNLGLQSIYLAKLSSTTKQFIWKKRASKSSSLDDRNDITMALNNSNIYTSWSDFREGNYDIYTQKYDLNGNILWTNDQKINVNTGWSEQSHPQLLINTSGDTFSVWQDYRNNNFDIFITNFNNPGTTIGVAGVPLIITGTKRIGEDPVILKFEKYYTSDATGYVNITSEWDVPGYSIEINPASSSLSIIMRNPIQPINFLAGDTKNVLIYVE